VDIRKLKNGIYKAYGERLTVVAMEPNLRKHFVAFKKYDTDDSFLNRLSIHYPILKTKKGKIKVAKFAGCWYIRSAKDERLLMIHDPETDDIDRAEYSKDGKRRRK
jgi:hypothetical protein